MKGGDKKYKDELEIQLKLMAALEEGKPARTADLTDDERAYAETLFLITTKKVIYCCNISESDTADCPLAQKVKDYAAAEGSETIVLCADMEAELASMSQEDREMFMEELGISGSGLNQLVETGYKTLGLMSFLTAGEKETRAWTIPIGTKAPQAAGKIHSDFEKGFIRAEVVSYENLIACGSYTAAKEKGKVRSEGKDYIFQEGDVVLFRFNV